MTDNSVLKKKGGGDVEHDDTSWSLVERARSGNEVAWRQLIAWVNPLLLYWCRKGGLQDADALDICQEVAQAMSRNLETYQKTKSSFRGWIKVITTNKIYDHHRRRVREPEAVGGSAAQERMRINIADPLMDSADSTAEEESILYRRALELLQQEFAEKTWRAFWGVVIESKPAADVAEELGMTTNAVYLARGRIMGRLRREFCSEISPAGIVAEPVGDPESAS